MHSNRFTLFACLVPLVLTTAASAQDGGCQATVLQNPPRTLLTCPNGVTITAEDGTTFSLDDRDPAVPGPEGVHLDDQGVLVEVPPGGVPGGFEVTTPQAIAAVRGTRWAVDVQDGKTSVFVVRGTVAVRRSPDDPSVDLGPGEGVDVEEGTRSVLTVRRWGAERSSSLLARFGE